MVSSTFKQEAYKEVSGEALIHLLTISHEALTDPIRVNDSGETVVSNGNTYIYCPFTVILPSKSPEESPKCRIKVDNVDRRMVQAVRSITTPADILVQVVRSTDLNVVEVELSGFKLVNVDYNALEISGDVTLEQFLMRPYPVAIFDPGRFPGGFALPFLFLFLPSLGALLC